MWRPLNKGMTAFDPTAGEPNAESNSVNKCPGQLIELEPVNAYALLANEFYKPVHITSRNFDAATLEGLKGFKHNSHSGLILELGAGRGRSGEFLHFAPERRIQTDVTKEMLELEPRETSLLKVCCDARATPFLDKTFDCVCAFLYDSYNTLDLYKEVARVLCPAGLFIGTLPAFDWGTTLRKELGLPPKKTRFTLQDGTVILTASLLSPEGEIREWAKSVGLEAEVRLLKLPSSVSRVSPDIARSAKAHGVAVMEIPIVQLVVARKLS